MLVLPIIYAALVLGGIGIAFGLILTLAGRAFAVENHALEEAICHALPGANCGACGYPSCESLAAAILHGDAKPSACIPGGRETVTAIANLLSAEPEDVDAPKMARVFCQGSSGIAQKRYDYAGLKGCHIAAQMGGGPKECPYACLGFGDCVAACKFSALAIENGIANVDETRCTACGMCQKACPRRSIQLFPADKKATILCQNHLSPKAARKACQKACIACARCAQACKFDAIQITDNLAQINTEKCTKCRACVGVCPMGCVVVG